MWYKCWKSGDAYYAAFYNFGSETEEGSVPVEGGTFARQLVGPAVDCGMERGVLFAEVPPRTLLIFSIMQTPSSGLYRNNVMLTNLTPGIATMHAADGVKGAIYIVQNGVRELVSFLHNGDTIHLSPHAIFKPFLWDAQLRPMVSVSK